MTYIPVGTVLTYTCTYTYNPLTSIYKDNSWSSVAGKLANDLPNLPGMEELDVQNSNGSTSLLSTQESLSINVLNNGVDHASETDVQSIIDGTIQGYGYTVIGSNITHIQLPNNPPPPNQLSINTGATPNVAAPATASLPNLSNLLPSISPTATITSGFVILLIAIVALILLLPQGFGRAIRAVR